LVVYHLAQATVEIAERLHLAAPELPEAAKDAVDRIRTGYTGDGTASEPVAGQASRAVRRPSLPSREGISDDGWQPDMDHWSPGSSYEVCSRVGPVCWKGRYHSRQSCVGTAYGVRVRAPAAFMSGIASVIDLR
jgi:hypothetical protein